MKRKLLAVVLALFMTFGLIPGLPMLTAYAADFTVTDEAGLTAAIAGAGAGDVIIVGADITLTSDLSVNKDVTIISAGAKIIAGSNKIIIPISSSVSFGQSLSVTGSAYTGYHDGLIVVEGSLTIQPGGVSIENGYAGGAAAGNSSAVYVDGGRFDMYGGSVSDTAAGGSNVSCGICLNGGEANISDGSVSGSCNGIESRGGASLWISGGTIGGNYGVFFYGYDGGTFYMTDGTVNGVYAAIRIIGSAPAQSSRIIGGTVESNNSYGVELEQFSSVLISGCSITGAAGQGGIFVESGSALDIYQNGLSITGGVRAFDTTMDGAAFLTALPSEVSVDAGDTVSFSLTGAETTFEIGGETTASLNASLSADAHTVTLDPTAAGAQTLVLTSAVDLHDEDYGGDYKNSIKLSIPVEVTEPDVERGTWLTDPENYDTGWYDGGESSFVITNAAELAGFAKLVGDGDNFSDKTVTIDAPGGIDLSAHDWVPAGLDSAFSGTFDGGNDPITGLIIGNASAPETMYGAAGLFGHLASAVVRNVRLTGILFHSGAGDTGGLAGEIYNSTIINCTANGAIICYGEDAQNAGVLLGMVAATQIESCGSAGSVSVEYADSSLSAVYTGGLCGQVASDSILSDCHNTADVHVGEKEAYAGGICGLAIESSIENTSNTGNVSNTGDTAIDAENNEHYLGGIAGVFRGSMQNCYNTGSVQGSGLLVFCGGIAAIMNLTDTNSIQDSYNTGSVSAEGKETYSGGIVSILQEDEGTIENCFNIGMVKDTDTGSGYTGGVISNDLPDSLISCYYLQGNVSRDGGYNAMARSVVDFHESDTFVGWDFDGVWQFAAGMGRYPTLRENAQENGYAYPLSFHITDANNAGIAGAMVTLNKNGTATEYPVSNASGYSSSSVPAGNYPYTIEKSGYMDFSGSVFIQNNTSAIIPITLQADEEDGGDDDHPGSGSHFASVRTYDAVVTKDNIQAETLPVAVNEAAGTGTVSLNKTNAEELFSAAADTVITMPAIPGVSSYTLEVPAASLEGTPADGCLNLQTPAGGITIPGNMLDGLPGTEGKKAGITIGQGDRAALFDKAEAAVGGKPLIQLTLTLDGAQYEWNNPAARVAVSMPYTPTAQELTSSECLIVWRIDGSGHRLHASPTGTMTLRRERSPSKQLIFPIWGGLQQSNLRGCIRRRMVRQSGILHSGQRHCGRYGRRELPTRCKAYARRISCYADESL